MDSFPITHDRQAVISLAAGFPKSGSRAGCRARADHRRGLDDVGRDALGYIDSGGLPELREQPARRGAASGFATDLEELHVVSGPRQGIDLRGAAAPRGRRRRRVADFRERAGLAAPERGPHAGGRHRQCGFSVDALERILARHEIKLVALGTA